jgi:hypothetical protein
VTVPRQSTRPEDNVRPLKKRDPVNSATPKDPPSSFGIVFDLAKVEFEAQQKLADRYDMKVRATLGLATLIFGVAQASMVRVLDSSTPTEKDFIIALAALAFVSLVLALGFAVFALMPRETTQIKGQWLVTQFDRARTDNAQVHVELVTELAKTVRSRQADNAKRGTRTTISQSVSVFSIALACLELLVQIGALPQ